VREIREGDMYQVRVGFDFSYGGKLLCKQISGDFLYVIAVERGIIQFLSHRCDSPLTGYELYENDSKWWALHLKLVAAAKE
jgi:hypothetical protein